MTDLRLQLWTEAQFEASRDAWTSLLARSGADPLFMGWDWQWRWWTHHHKTLSAQLVLIAAYAPDGALVGLVPFYVQRLRLRGLIPVRRLQLIGGAWRDSGPAFSEYLDFICAPSDSDALLDGLARWLLASRTWDELVLPNVLPDSLAARFARDTLSHHALVRRIDPMVARRLRLPRDFASYVSGLSSGTRRRLLHQRRKAGGPPLSAGSEGEAITHLKTLRALKTARWAGRRHSEPFLRFHDDFARAMARLGQLRLTQLQADGATASVLYDVRVGSTEYYLESAFDADRARGVTPGYLHLGYAIEQACADGLERFDFLGGEGRHRDYKRDLCPEETTLFCYQVIRNPLLRALYGVHRRLEKIKTAAGADRESG
jgi:CelD/BcsL family acetyltransferase involved in cellulose biosynthesis